MVRPGTAGPGLESVRGLPRAVTGPIERGLVVDSDAFGGAEVYVRQLLRRLPERVGRASSAGRSPPSLVGAPRVTPRGYVRVLAIPRGGNYLKVVRDAVDEADYEVVDS